MTLYHYVELFVILFTLYGIAVGSYPKFRMNRATIALAGASILIFIGAISVEQAYSAIDMNTIVLLFSMMIINGNLRISGFFKIVTSHIITLAKTPAQLLVLIVLSSGLLSALFLNDTIVIVFTPLVIDVVKTLKRNPVPYLIGLVTAANIGSSATIIGNPQNMIIGISSGISFSRYSMYQIVPSLFGLIVVLIIIIFLYRKEFRKEAFGKIETVSVKPYKPLLIKSSIASLVMLVALFGGISVPIAALAGACILLITRRLKPERVFQEIDWSLLVFFAALFIVTKSIDTSGYGAHLEHTFEPYLTQNMTTLAISSSIFSNIVSNVPTVLLFRPIIPKFFNADQAWMVLGMATTFAGNLTLIGSVANLIVAESAKKYSIKIGFGEYLKTGLIVTIITLVFGILWFSLVF